MKRLVLTASLAGLLGAGLPGAYLVAQAAAKPSPAVPASAANGYQLDLNTATASQLKTLPGIGDAYAKRIVDARPFTAKNQLLTKGIVPQSTYDRIKDSVVAHHAAKQ